MTTMPEVGGELADYFDPHSFDSMYGAIAKAVCDKNYVTGRAKSIDQSKLRRWPDVADHIWREVSATPGASLQCAPQFAEIESTVVQY